MAANKQNNPGVRPTKNQTKISIGCWFSSLLQRKREQPDTSLVTNSGFATASQSALDNASCGNLSADPNYRSGVTLADLLPGQCGDILRITASTQGRLRLLEMGLTPGTHIKLLRAAAFGGPLDVLVRGYKLSLRVEEAATVCLGNGKTVAGSAIGDAAGTDARCDTETPVTNQTLNDETVTK